MMDWEQIAHAVGVESPPDELAKSLAPLQALEGVFRPLVSRLAPEDEPAVIFEPLLESASE
jgi:hypothetical protein